MIVYFPSQTDSKAVWDWFYTNAPAGWISAGIAFTSLLVILRSRKKPKKLFIRETAISSVVRVSPQIRDKIRVTFNEVPIQTLGRIDVEIFNSGSEPIQKPEFRIELPKDCAVLDVEITPQQGQVTPDQNAVAVALPYLNPVGDHDQIVKLSLLVDGISKIVATHGGGEGWSVAHSALPDQKTEIYWLLGISFSMILFGMFQLFWSWHIRRTYGVLDPWSMHFFLVNLPVYASMAIILSVFLVSQRRALQRVFKGLLRGEMLKP